MENQTGFKIYAIAHRYNQHYQDRIDIEFIYAKTEAEAFLKSDFYADLEDSYTYELEDKPPLPVDYPELAEFLENYYEVHITIKEGPLV